MSKKTHKYRGCTMVRETGKSTYFGVNLRRPNQTKWFHVTFPDLTWIKCANLKESREYIDTHIGEHNGPPSAYLAEIEAERQAERQAKLATV